ncbi:hypothetical protein GCM10023335_65090 [Streptomyces siamensis]|uniref:Uncharacterized protein n=1 Tax=Streptomyces siamensis TaxID=1274986 RepID=A0ABP9JFP2_9ACTN
MGFVVRSAVAVYVAVEGRCPCMRSVSLPRRANVHPFSAAMACRALAVNCSAVLGSGAGPRPAPGRDVAVGPSSARVVREEAVRSPADFRFPPPCGEHPETATAVAAATDSTATARRVPGRGRVPGSTE